MYGEGFYLGDMAEFGLPKFYSSSENFRERKAERSEFYFKRIYKNKLEDCTACSGYRYYCGGACGACEGTGKQRER